ncbi:MAG: hypothetical protein ABI901_10845, partial [Roseiflexaceae bacterium]
KYTVLSADLVIQILDIFHAMRPIVYQPQICVDRLLADVHRRGPAGQDVAGIRRDYHVVRLACVVFLWRIYPRCARCHDRL